MTYWRRLLKTVKDVPAQDLNLGAGIALTFLVRVSAYALVAVAGIVMARALGAHDRGVYSLVITIALVYAAFSELGISRAGIYFVGQKRHSLQAVTSNNLAWLLGVGAIWVTATVTLGVVRPAFVPDELQLPHFLMFALGGVLLQLLLFAQDQQMTSGSVLGYNLIEFTEPVLRGVLIMGAIVLFGAGIVGVLSSWLLAIMITGLLAIYLMSKRARVMPRIGPGLLKAQLSYGLKSQFGFVFQAANHRLDVFLVVGFVGATALGHYAVAFGMVEMLWQIPFAVGTVLFPKIAALDAEANAETAATTCRRALFIVLLGVLAFLASGRFLIGTLYGAEFLPGLTAFYILAPSALFYTVHRVLSSALAARGMPEASLYGGLASFPVTIGLGLLLIPAIGIEGAAIASISAYAVNAAVILLIFLRVTGRSMLDVLLINRADVTVSVETARTFLARPEPVGAE